MKSYPELSHDYVNWRERGYPGLASVAVSIAGLAFMLSSAQVEANPPEETSNGAVFECKDTQVKIIDKRADDETIVVHSASWVKRGESLPKLPIRMEVIDSIDGRALPYGFPSTIGQYALKPGVHEIETSLQLGTLKA